MKQWKKIAEGNNLNIAEEDLERITGALDELETAFRPLVKTIPHDLEPATTFSLEAQGGAS